MGLKDGEHEGVGTMSSVPGIDFAEKSNCQNTIHTTISKSNTSSTMSAWRRTIEHYGMELHEHTWPEQVGGTYTYELIWEFNQFSN